MEIKKYLYSGGSGLSVDLTLTIVWILTYCTVKTFQPPSSLRRGTVEGYSVFEGSKRSRSVDTQDKSYTHDA